MNPIWAIAAYHFRKNVLSKGFIIALAALPFFVTFTLLLGYLINLAEKDNTPLGVIDPSGVIRVTEIPGADEPLDLRFFAEAAEADAALEAREISGYYLLPTDYPQTDDVSLYYIEPVDWQTQSAFADLLRVNLLEGYTSEVIERIIRSPEVLYHSIPTGRLLPESGPRAGNLAPIILVLVFIFGIFTVSDMLVGALGDEKANRTIEIVMTSVKPEQLIAGKILAVVGSLVIEILVWLMVLLLGVWIGGSLMDFQWLQNIEVIWLDILQVGLLCLTGLGFYSAFLILVGSLLHQVEDVQQAASIVILPLFLPVYILPIIMETPDSPIAMLFSLLPITSAQTLGIQILFFPLPLWNVLTALVFNLAATVFCGWLAARAFRRGGLRYGQPLRLLELFGTPKPKGESHD